MDIEIKIEIEVYKAPDGSAPFIEWLENLKDKTVRYRIKERLNRVALRNFGDHKYISNGVFELRLSFSSGFRIYYGKIAEKVILLLCGGDKHSQVRDIEKAIHYWSDYCGDSHV